MLFIGIDISKLKFDVSLLFPDLSYKHQCFENNTKGFKSLFTFIKTYKEEALFCMEATNIYWLPLAKYLHAKNKKVLVINPIKTNAFSKMEMNRNKTDKADSKCIARYLKHLASKKELDKYLFKPKSKNFEKLQYLNTRLEQLNKTLNQEQNRLEASFDKDVVRSITRTINNITKEINKIKLTISNIIIQDEYLNNQLQLLISIDGIGEKTAWAILAYIGDIIFYSSAKQITAYAGLNPRIEQSGTSINKSRLSKLGNKRLRKSLYMPALVAIRYNAKMLDLYERLLQRGKPKKVALCAVMRKLLVLSYGVLKSGKPFSFDYQN